MTSAEGKDTVDLQCIDNIVCSICVNRSLQQLLDYTEDDLEETFCLNFTVRIQSVTSVVKVPDVSCKSCNRKLNMSFLLGH